MIILGDFETDPEVTLLPSRDHLVLLRILQIGESISTANMKLVRLTNITYLF